MESITFSSPEAVTARKARRQDRQVQLQSKIRIIPAALLENNRLKEDTFESKTKSDMPESSDTAQKSSDSRRHDSEATTTSGWGGSTLLNESIADLSLRDNFTKSSSKEKKKKATIGLDPVPGFYPDKEAFKSAQWKKRIDLFKTSTAIIAALAALGVGIFFPPALPAVAGGAALLHPAVLKVITTSLGIALTGIGDLCGNREAFPKAKAKVLKNIKSFNDKWMEIKDPLSKLPRFKAHVEFLDRLVHTLNKFADTIRDKDYDECLGVCFAFEEDIQTLLAQFLQQQQQVIETSSVRKEQKEAKHSIYEIQEFFRKYDKYMKMANQEMVKDGKVSEKTRLNLVELQKTQEESHIPALQQWADSEETYAYCLPRLREHQST